MGQLDEDVLVGWPEDVEILLREDVLRAALLDRPGLAFEEGVDLGDHRIALRIRDDESLDHIAVGDTRDAMRQYQRNLEQLVKMQQRGHPAEVAGAPPVVQ